MEKQNYDFFLFTKLAQANGLVREELEYDYQFEELESLYNEYDNSIYNSEIKGAYECILDYISAKLKEKKNQQDDFYKMVNELVDIASKITDKYKK